MHSAVADHVTRSQQTALSVSQLAARWGVDPHNVLSWIRSGRLRAFDVAASRAGLSRKARERRNGKISRPRWRISLEAIAEFEAKQSSRPAPYRPPRVARPRNQTEVIQFV